MLSDDKIQAAEEHTRERRRTEPYAMSARYDSALQKVIIDLSTGYSIAFAPERAQGLLPSTPEQLNAIELSSFGIHFPELDAHFTVEGMLAGRFGNPRWEREWADKHRRTAA